MSSDGQTTGAEVIRVEGLSKRYRLGERETYRRLGESLTRAVQRPFKKSGPRRSREVLWALRDVSFNVNEGEIVGIVGPNGAGKTTLLRILSQITLPTEGRAEIHGRVGSLLEVGTGFHPELTGRENVFLNGAILGMSRQEITRKYEEIVDFAQIDKFMDTPVKHYSSGMRVRLAFSVAAHLEPEILFIDEVLSVGDAAFQEKCLQKMQDVAGAGRTILFISHHMGSITNLCTRALWIDHGTIQMDGEPRQVIESYLSHGDPRSARWEHPEGLDCGQEVRIKSIEVRRASGELDASVPFDEPTQIHIEHEVRSPVWGLVLQVRIKDMGGTIILVTSNMDTDAQPGQWEPGSYRHNFEIPASLLRPGRYIISATAKVKRQKFDEHDHCLGFDILTIGYTKRREGIITPVLLWTRNDVTAGVSPSADHA